MEKTAESLKKTMNEAEGVKKKTMSSRKQKLGTPAGLLDQVMKNFNI